MNIVDNIVFRMAHYAVRSKEAKSGLFNKAAAIAAVADVRRRYSAIATAIGASASTSAHQTI